MRSAPPVCSGRRPRGERMAGTGSGPPSQPRRCPVCAALRPGGGGGKGAGKRAEPAAAGAVRGACPARPARRGALRERTGAGQRREGPCSAAPLPRGRRRRRGVPWGGRGAVRAEGLGGRGAAAPLRARSRPGAARCGGPGGAQRIAALPPGLGGAAGPGAFPELAVGAPRRPGRACLGATGWPLRAKGRRRRAAARAGLAPLRPRGTAERAERWVRSGRPRRWGRRCLPARWDVQRVLPGGAAALPPFVAGAVRVRLVPALQLPASSAPGAFKALLLQGVRAVPQRQAVLLVSPAPRLVLCGASG